MPGLRLKDIAGMVGAPVPEGRADADAVAGYAIDTRLLAPGEIFFALKGEARDGHDFVRAAFDRGALAAVVERPVEGLPPAWPQIAVPSVLGALHEIARRVRERSGVPVVAVTGSNGKTTTKEMIAHLLATRLEVRKSPGNFNNHIGLPLSILALGPRDQVLVVELGTNHRGEIAALAGIARPHVGVVTNVGRAHIGLLGSMAAVAQEKTDLLRNLCPGGRGVVNADDPLVAEAIRDVKLPVVRFGLTSAADYRAADVNVTAGSASFSVSGETITVRTGGLHSVYNALAAIATASLFGISVKEAAAAMPRFAPVRMSTASSGGLTVIDDSYNANPDSMAAALDVLSRTEAARRVLVMGEMHELGAAAESLHREVGTRVAGARVDVFVGIGGPTRQAVEEAVRAGMKPDQVFWFGTKADAKSALRQILRPEDAVLVKASRMAGLEEIIDFLKTGVVAGRT